MQGSAEFLGPTNSGLLLCGLFIQRSENYRLRCEDNYGDRVMGANLFLSQQTVENPKAPANKSYLCYPDGKHKAIIYPSIRIAPLLVS